jgi:transposase
VELSRSLLSGWVDACRLLSPLEEALQDYVLTDGKLMPMIPVGAVAGQ